MREIEFRGRAEKGERWVYGDLVRYAGRAQIWEHQPDGGTWNYIVDPDTVGQFTGVTDRKNQKPIFEGDIIRKLVPIYGLDGKPCGERVMIGIVAWHTPLECETQYPGHWCIKIKDQHGNDVEYEFYDVFEVIGNVYDNAELLQSN